MKIAVIYNEKYWEIKLTAVPAVVSCPDSFTTGVPSPLFFMAIVISVLLKEQTVLLTVKSFQLQSKATKMSSSVRKNNCYCAIIKK